MSRVKIELKENVVNRIKEICRSFNNEPGELINVLHQTQQEFGYLPAEVQEVIASELNIRFTTSLPWFLKANIRFPSAPVQPVM